MRSKTIALMAGAAGLAFAGSAMAQSSMQRGNAMAPGQANTSPGQRMTTGSGAMMPPGQAKRMTPPGQTFNTPGQPNRVTTTGSTTRTRSGTR